MQNKKPATPSAENIVTALTQTLREVVPSCATVVIKHGVATTEDFLLGQPTGFPVGDLLSPLVIRRAIACLRTRNVQSYDDGLFHGDISRLGMYDLVASLSAADAVAEDFHSLTDKKGLVIKHLNIRWTVSDTLHECRIYGPQSDPANTILIDLTRQDPIQDSGAE